MTAIKLKICGVNENPIEVSGIKPDYLGLIFYSKSPRYYDGPKLHLSSTIQLVGVFVNMNIQQVLAKTEFYSLDVIQLHGNESPEYCQQLRQALQQQGLQKKVWKVVSVSDRIDFNSLRPFTAYADCFLFDTFSKARGGSGKQFNWNILNDYNLNKPFILSGGVDPESIEAIRRMAQSGLPLHAVDINSRFEIKPGLKDIQKLKSFVDELYS